MATNDSSRSWRPVHVIGESRASRWIVICDHAANVVPPFVNDGDLGVSNADMARHIAYDVGARGLAIRLADLLEAPAVLANFSRLVIDPNRGEDDPTLVMRLYDGTIVPANRHIGEGEIRLRTERCYRPYHDTIGSFVGRRDDTVVISVHSFTPQFRHRQHRPWHAGILYGGDARLSQPLIELLRQDPKLVVGDNQPYSGALSGDTIDRHAIRSGRQNTLIEIRNDLIGTDSEQDHWAGHLAEVLPRALNLAEG